MPSNVLVPVEAVVTVFNAFLTRLTGLSQMDATWGIGCDSSGHVTPRRIDCNYFPPTSAAGTPPVAA
jgi:hypothetical protein